jgi:uncharacterized oxidoreductase
VNLHGRQALVTGGSSGLGLALSQRLLDLGCDVLTCGRDGDRLADAASRLPGLRTVAADLATAAGREHVVEHARRELPDLSVLVNNAAVQHLVDWVGGDPDDVYRTAEAELATNLLAPLQLTAHLLPQLLEADEAVVVNVASGLAVVPKRSAPTYCASKAALRAFSTSLRHQTAAAAPHVHVLDAVLPLVDTPMTAGRGRRKLSPAQVADRIVDGIVRDRAVLAVGAVRPLMLLNRLAPAVATRILRDS